jgi:peroxiredoxin
MRLFFSAFIFCVVFCSSGWAVGDLLSSTRKSWVGKKMVDFEAPNLQAVSVETDVYRADKIFLMTMGKINCPSCTQFLHILGSIDQEYQEKGVAFLNISFDSDLVLLRKKSMAAKVDFDTLIDEEGALAEYYGIENVPTTIIADKKGKILYFEEGIIELDRLRKILDRVLQ